MNSYYVLIIINLIVFLLLPTNQATAGLTSDIILDNWQQTNISSRVTCDYLLPQSLSSFNDSKQQSERNQNIIKHKNKNKNDIAQASIWWAAKQFDPFDGNLVENWLTLPHKQQINLTVDWQLWSLLDYFGRYRFVNQFGTVVRKHGYNLNVISQKEQCLATYKYNSIGNPPKWELHLEKIGRDSLETESNSIKNNEI